MFAFSFLVSLLLTQSMLQADQAAATAPDTGMTQTLVMVAIALAFFYFILWRPEQKRRKAMENLRSGMKKGDRVVCMGLVGTIAKIKEETIVVRSAGSELEFLKAAISEVSPGTAEESKESKETKE
jgi:preprotein translocase subunit YajC